MALREKVKLKRINKYFEAVQPVFGNMREPVTFHESHPVSTSLLLPGFVLCSITMGSGIVLFMVECQKYRVQKFIEMLLMLRVAVFCGIFKILLNSASPDRHKRLDKIIIVRSAVGSA